MQRTDAVCNESHMCRCADRETVRERGLRSTPGVRLDQCGRFGNTLSPSLIAALRGLGHGQTLSASLVPTLQAAAAR